MLCHVYMDVHSGEPYPKSILESNHIPIQLHNQRPIIIYILFVCYSDLLKITKVTFIFILLYILFYKSQLFLNYAHAY